MQLYYRKAGEGPVMIIQHGLYGMSGNWMSVAKSLARNFQVYVPDMRNHGRSPHDPRHDYGAMQEDLLEFMDRHDIPKAILMGHSMGGKVVMHFALDHPRRVSALGVIDISPRSYNRTSLHSELQVDHEGIIKAMMGVDLDRAGNIRDIEDQLSHAIPSSRVRKFLLKNLSRDKNGHYHWQLNLRALLDNLQEIFGGPGEGDLAAKGGITGFPVLFIRGEHSPYIDDIDHHLIKKIFPHADITTIPGTGHWLHAEKPGLLVRTIEYFLLNGR